MQVRCESLIDGARNARGVAVVVDVFRAFTCLPWMFALGLDEALLVASPEEAFSLKARQPDLILAGEMDGYPVEGFDLGNSPSQILRQEPGFFEGRKVVQRSSAGVQGVLAALEHAEEVLPASFAVAARTADYLRGRAPRQVSVVAMGLKLLERAPEDEWCARYIAHLLDAGPYDHPSAMREILFHPTTQKFFDPQQPAFPAEDPALCLQRDVHGFVLQASVRNGCVVVKKMACT